MVAVRVSGFEGDSGGGGGGEMTCAGLTTAQKDAERARSGPCDGSRRQRMEQQLELLQPFASDG